MRASLQALALLLAPLTAAAGTPPLSDAEFCSRAQRLIARTAMRPVNVLYTERGAFIRSKPRVRPLETAQFVSHTREPAPEPMVVSCKMNSSDHLVAEYGPGAAGPEGACRNVNADTVARVFAALTPAEHGRLAVRQDQVVLEPDDEALTGASWSQGAQPARRSAGGELLIRARSIRVDWTDWKWAWLPDRFRGQHSCHLIAPEYLRRLLLGEAKPDPD